MQYITLTHILSAIALTITMIGWFIIAWLNRKNEIKKSLLQLRLSARRIAIDCITRYRVLLDGPKNAENSYNELALSATVAIEEIGTKEEVELWDIFVSNVTKLALQQEELSRLINDACSKQRRWDTMSINKLEPNELKIVFDVYEKAKCVTKLANAHRDVYSKLRFLLISKYRKELGAEKISKSRYMVGPDIYNDLTVLQQYKATSIYNFINTNIIEIEKRFAQKYAS